LYKFFPRTKISPSSPLLAKEIAQVFQLRRHLVKWDHLYTEDGRLYTLHSEYLEFSSDADARSVTGTEAKRVTKLVTQLQRNLVLQF
jgi:hypothetical protein